MIRITADSLGRAYALDGNRIYRGKELISLVSSIDKNLFKGKKSNNYVYVAKRNKNDIIYTNKFNHKQIKLENYKTTAEAIRKEYHELYPKNPYAAQRVAIGSIGGLAIVGSIVIGAMALKAGKNVDFPEPEEKEVIELNLNNTSSNNNIIEEEHDALAETYNTSAEYNSYTIPKSNEILLAPYEHLTPVEVDVKAEADAQRDKQLEPYIDIIKARCEKWGVNYNLFYDICAQEYGGTGNNLCHVVFNSWQDQVLTAYNFQEGKIEQIVLTDTPENYAGKDIQTISRDELNTPEVNVSVGAIIMQYTANMLNGNMGLSIQAYNNGIYAVKDVVRKTSAETGVDYMNIINDQNNFDWMNYTYIVQYGDQDYFKHVVANVFPEQMEEDEILNDTYQVEYLQNNGEIESTTFRAKLR